MNWDAIVAELGPKLFRYFLGSFAQPLAADLVQEVLLRLVVKCREQRFDPARGTLPAYAFGIAHFVRLEALKARVPEEAMESRDFATAGDSPETLLQKAREVRRLRQAIARLSPAQQQVVLLTLDRDLSLDEISCIVGLPLGTVKSHLFRAREGLKAILIGESEEESWKNEMPS